MKIPEQLQAIDGQDVVIREYESEHTIAADFGPETDETSRDSVDDTAIVVMGRDQFEFELPDDAGEISINNGVLTLER